MASFKPAVFLLASVFAFLFLSTPTQCKDEVDSVYKGINSFRQTKNLSPLNRVPKAYCLADELAEEMEDIPCEHVSQYYPGGSMQIPKLQKHIDKCDINASTTSDGVILPVCVAKLEPTVVLSNYTHSDVYAQHLNNSKYTGAGIGSKDDWMVLVLTTNTPTGTFAADASTLHAGVEFLLLALLILLINYLY